MYKRYEKYKDSGVDWIGEVPEHWGTMKMSWFFGLISSGVTPDSSSIDYYDNGNIPWLNTGDLNDGYIYKTKKFINDLALRSHSALKVYQPNALVIALYGATIGKLGITKISLSANQACCVLTKPKEVDVKFVFYWFYANRKQIISMSYGGGQPNISQNLIKSLRVIMPFLTEQIIISSFLDHKTSEIDSLIADKEELIKKLEEYKQSIITEAVTKGLNPNVKMKDSGVEWIGEIPEHWEVVQIRRLLKNGSEGIKIGPFGSQLKLEQLEASGYRVYGQENLIKNDFSIGNRFLSDDKYGELKVYRVEPGDLLISMMGTIGRTSIVPKEIEEGIMDSHLIRLRFKDEILTMFVNALFCNAKYLIYQNQLLSKGTIMSGLNSTIVKNIIVVVPPYGEQLEILNEINRAIRSCESLANDVQDQLYNLKFYRQSLIFEAVTGKIDVRDYQHERSEQLA